MEVNIGKKHHLGCCNIIRSHSEHVCFMQTDMPFFQPVSSGLQEFHLEKTNASLRALDKVIKLVSCQILRSF